MKGKKKIYFVILSLSVILLAGKTLHPGPIKVTELPLGQTVLLPPSAPDTGQLIPVSFLPIASETEIVAGLVVYDDPRTKRPVDYLELYDASGALLLISWVDRFGIHRTAMDRGLLLKDDSKLEGVLVLLPEGTLT